MTSVNQDANLAAMDNTLQRLKRTAKAENTPDAWEAYCRAYGRANGCWVPLKPAHEHLDEEIWETPVYKAMEGASFANVLGKSGAIRISRDLIASMWYDITELPEPEPEPEPELTSYRITATVPLELGFYVDAEDEDDARAEGEEWMRNHQLSSDDSAACTHFPNPEITLNISGDKLNDLDGIPWGVPELSYGEITGVVEDDERQGA